MTHTWSGWVKRDKLGAWERYFSATGQTLVQLTGASPPNQFRYLNQAGGVNFDLRTNGLLRDSNSWMNVIFAVDHTQTIAENRVKIYFNGIRVDRFDTNTATSGAQDLLTDWNESGLEHGLLGRDGNNPGENFRGEAFDVYWVDGMQLPPEVFGYHKKDAGYESVGSQKASSFTPGQWSPRLPKSVKYDINSRGGFGANGFYIPLNDSSNPGADFHCDPNTIVKLKGEDEPQPRNGAPATTDTYVSQLRYEVGTLGFDGAVKFDGSGDYLSLAANADCSFDGDFTVEAFVYPTALNTFNTIFSTEDLDFKFISTGAFRIYTSGGSNTTGTISLNQWSHVALVRQGSTFKVYINGNGETVSPPAFTGDGSSAAEIGRKINNSSEEFTGFISNLRVVKGTAVYTADFTAPTEPLTNVTNTKLLCCNSSTSATASTVTPGTITANGNAFATRNELTGSIVLAVPGLNQNTVNNMVFNGNFDNGLSGWTVNGTTEPSIASANFLAEKGTGALITTGTLDGSIWQAVSGSVNQKYLITFDIVQNNGGFFGLYINSNGPNDGGSLVKDNITTIGRNFFIRDGNLTAIEFRHRGSSSGIVDNINVVPLDQSSFRDYSADIKGSGSNKTLTVGGGNPGIVSSHSFYGSAMSFRQEDSDNISIAGVPAFGTGDWTVEEWVRLPKEFAPQSYWRSSLGVNGDSNTTGAVTIYHCQTAETNAISGGVSFIGKANQYRLYAPIDIRDDNWHHIAVEKYNNVVTLYLDGKAFDNSADTNNYYATDNTGIGISKISEGNYFTGEIQDVRVYQGIAKYKGGFDVSKPYAPVGFGPGSWRTTPINCRNKFATLMPLSSGSVGLTNGNQYIDQGSGGWHSALATHTVSSGKWYAELRIDRLGWFFFGVEQPYLETDNRHMGGQAGSKGMGIVYNTGNRGDITYNGVNNAFTGGDATASNGDVISIALDLDNNNVKFFKNNVLQYNLSNQLEPGAHYSFGVSPFGSVAVTTNFGQNPSFCDKAAPGTNTDGNGMGLFKYAPPTGFLALCDQNLPAPTIPDPSEYFKAVLWRGDSTAGREIQCGFKPDMVWIKDRDDTSNFSWFDSVRGAGKHLSPNTLNAEETGFERVYNPGFTENGFTVGTDGAVNGGTNYVGYCFKLGGNSDTFNIDGTGYSTAAAAGLNSGTITPTGASVGTTQGISVLTYTGNGTAGANISHGLSKAPELMIHKSRDQSKAWYTITTVIDGSADYLYLSSAVPADNSAVTLPTDDLMYFTSSNESNFNNEDYVVHCFHSVEGFSKIGTYIGSGTDDGPMIVCGFKPAWLMVKRVTTGGNEGWPIYDNVRGSINPNAKGIYANANGGDNDASGRYKDFLSNGFKIRGTSGEQNTDGVVYLYMAFAESPFLTANAK